MPGNNEPQVVVIGGGSGSAVLLSGLKPHTRNITAIVSMFDSGGSTGILRESSATRPSATSAMLASPVARR